MPLAQQYSLTKGEVIMHLSLAGLNRKRAANDAGISERTLRRLMKCYRLEAPRANAKLSVVKVRKIHVLLEKHSQEEVAGQLNVHPRTVGMVARYETWYWVK